MPTHLSDPRPARFRSFADHLRTSLRAGVAMPLTRLAPRAPRRRVVGLALLITLLVLLAMMVWLMLTATAAANVETLPISMGLVDPLTTPPLAT
jgi:hypothetical protein